jgi:hypothetical protein
MPLPYQAKQSLEQGIVIKSAFNLQLIEQSFKRDLPVLISGQDVLAVRR